MPHIYDKIVICSCISLIPLAQVAQDLSSRVDDPQLKELATGIGDILTKARAESTINKYSCYFKKWERWCATFEEVQPFPAKDFHFVLYIISLIQLGESFHVIESVFYAVKHFHNVASKPDPTSSTLAEYILEAAKRICHRKSSKKEPITSDHIRKIFQLINGDQANLLDLRNFTIIILSYAGFLRYDEVSNLIFGDILVFETYMKLFIEKSKTDQHREGAWVYIAKLDSPFCPVKTLLRFTKNANITNDNEYLFRATSFFKKKGIHKLRNKNKPICYSTARSAVLLYIKRIGLDLKLFGLHSLRRGGATEAANRGVNDRLFQKHGRWKTAGVKNGYVQEDINSLLKVSLGLGL
uniref:Tyr recombinase domain-containing protein n=1 Tax=Clytia hemisphaerica TaxID=252671 RepID=A0A7M5X3W6_9CNID